MILAFGVAALIAAVLVGFRFADLGGVFWIAEDEADQARERERLKKRANALQQYAEQMLYNYTAAKSRGYFKEVPIPLFGESRNGTPTNLITWKSGARTFHFFDYKFRNEGAKFTDTREQTMLLIMDHSFELPAFAHYSDFGADHEAEAHVAWSVCSVPSFLLVYQSDTIAPAASFSYFVQEALAVARFEGA